MPRDHRIQDTTSALLAKALECLDPAACRYPTAYTWVGTPPVFGCPQMVAWAEGPRFTRPDNDPKCRASYEVIYRLQLTRCCAPLADFDSGKVQMPDPAALDRFARDLRYDVDTLVDCLSCDYAWLPGCREVPRIEVGEFVMDGTCASATISITDDQWRTKCGCYSADGSDAC